MNSENPIHFSDYFQIDKAKLEELGVFDPILNYDTKVFVEPLLLKNSSSEIIRNSYQNYKHFFANLLLLLQKSQEHGDKCWRTAKKMVNFPEYQYTCIGYGSGTTEGRGSGTEFNDKILQSAKEIVDLADGNPEIFLLLPLLEDGIAGDRISDMGQNIIDDDICLYTRDIMFKVGLKGSYRYTTKNYNTYTLPLNPYSNLSIKLIPKDILLNLPVADNIDSLVEEMTAYNQRLREVISRDIGNIWLETTKAYRKGVLLRELKTNREFFIETLKALKEYKIEHYDLDKDYEGLYRWLANSQAFIDVELSKEATSCPDNLEALGFAITAIIKHFRDIIENKQVWQMFWTQYGGEYRHVREYYSQMLFFTVCNAWLTAQNSNINLKYDGKTLSLEFAISRKYRVIVHIRHANNSGLYNGYRAILEQHRNVSEEQHYYLIMNFRDEEATQLKEIKIIENSICKVFEISVTRYQADRKENAFETGGFELEDNKLNFADPLLEFEGINFSNAADWQSTGGKARHKDTTIIKTKIIKPMFLHKRNADNKATVSAISNSIITELNALIGHGENDKKVQRLMEKYTIEGYQDIEKTLGYLQKNSDGGQISNWCYQVTKEKL